MKKNKKLNLINKSNYPYFLIFLLTQFFNIHAQFPTTSKNSTAVIENNNEKFTSKELDYDLIYKNLLKYKIISLRSRSEISNSKKIALKVTDDYRKTQEFTFRLLKYSGIKFLNDDYDNKQINHVNFVKLANNLSSISNSKLIFTNLKSNFDKIKKTENASWIFHIKQKEKIISDTITFKNEEIGFGSTVFCCSSSIYNSVLNSLAIKTENTGLHLNSISTIEGEKYFYLPSKKSRNFMESYLNYFNSISIIPPPPPINILEGSNENEFPRIEIINPK